MNPDDLLAQIKELLTQYLALGENTPVAAEAQALASAIDATGGPASPEAPMQGQDVGTAMGLPSMGGAPPAHDPQDMQDEGYSGGSFEEARSGAKDFLDKKNKKKAKA